MKRILILFAVVATACGAPLDRLVYEGRTVRGIVCNIEESVPEGFDGMTLRTVSFINNSGSPVSVDAMEVGRVSVSGKRIWSFQPSSTVEREDWVLPVEKDFSKLNYLGMNDSDYGGGIPMVTLWTSDGNVSTGVAEPVIKLVSLPVKGSRNGAEACIRQDFEGGIILQPGDTLRSFRHFISRGKGDFFNPLRQFAGYMEAFCGYVPPVSPSDAFEAVWCAWGYERTFTVDEVVGTLPKVAELGFKWVDIDDGYQICEGDWQANDRIGGSSQMRRITRAVHANGLKAKLWWAPLAADPESRLAKEHPEMLLVRKDGTHEDISWWDSWYLSPVNPYTKDYTLKLVDMFMGDWGFDGFKLDGQHLNLSEPDYNPASELARPEEACERLPEIFAAIGERARKYNPEAVVQICPCGCAVNFFNVPFMNQAVASDPKSSAQIRMKRKAYAALSPGLAYYADHVELSDDGCDFPSQIGVGGVIGSKFTWPAPNPNVEGDGYLLTPEREELLRKWVGLYNSCKLSEGEYLNLYDLCFDEPEAHVIAKDGSLFYAFYTPSWSGEAIELRGLDRDTAYIVSEYTDKNGRTYEINGENPYIYPEFEKNYLIKVTPLK